jgi:sulfur relay (sulfurtransferase) DsrC/TusE family protein
MGNYNSTNESQEEQNTSEGLFVDRLLKVVTGFYNDETLSKNEKFNKTVDSINDSIKLQHLQSQTQNSIDRFYQKFNIVETKIIIPSIIMNTIGLQEFTTEHYKIIYDSRRFHEIYNLIPDVTNTVLMKNGRQHLHNRYSSKQSYNSIQSINNYYIGDFIARGGNGVVYSILNYNDRFIKFVHGDNVEKAIDSYLETIIQLILIILQKSLYELP